MSTGSVNRRNVSGGRGQASPSGENNESSPRVGSDLGAGAGTGRRGQGERGLRTGLHKHHCKESESLQILTDWRTVGLYHHL